MTLLDDLYKKRTQYLGHAAKPKPLFRPIFQVATTREGLDVDIMREPPEDTLGARMCFWWSRGRVELPVKQRLKLILVAWQVGGCNDIALHLSSRAASVGHSTDGN